MPSYTFVCDCGEYDYVSRSMEDCDKPYMCSDCGAKMKRDIAADMPFVSGGHQYGKAIHSDSLAITPDQVAEHKKQFPNIRIDSECRPIFETYKDHDNYLKKCGFKKEPQKIRHRGKKINQKLPTSKVAK